MRAAREAREAAPRRARGRTSAARATTNLPRCRSSAAPRRRRRRRRALARRGLRALHVERRAFELLVGCRVVQAGLNGGAEGCELALDGPSRAVASVVEVREKCGEGDPRGGTGGWISDEVVEAEEPAPAERAREGSGASAVPAGEDVGGAGVEEEAERERAARRGARRRWRRSSRGWRSRWGFRSAAGGVHRVRHGARGGHHEGEAEGMSTAAGERGW